MASVNYGAIKREEHVKKANISHVNANWLMTIMTSNPSKVRIVKVNVVFTCEQFIARCQDYVE